LTNDYKIILPLVFSCIIASLMTVGVDKESIYTMKLKRRGIIFSEGREVNILKSFSVKDFISHDHQLFINTERVGKIIDQAIGSKHHSFQIVDAENNHIGCFALNQLKNLLEEKDIVDSFVIAQDLAITDIKLDYEDNLEKAMKIFGRTDVAEIAVIQHGKFAGVVKRKDVIEAYNHEIIKREAAAGLVKKMKFTTDMQSFDFGTGYKFMEIDAPPAFWNKSLKGLDLKALHRIDVLLIKRKYPPQTITIPSGNEVIRKGDRLIIAGPEVNISEIMSGKRE